MSVYSPARRSGSACSRASSSARARRYSTGMTLRNFGRIAVPVVEDLGGARRAGEMAVADDERAQALGVAAGHVGDDLDQPAGLQVAGLMQLALGELLLLGDRLELDHGHVAAGLEGAVLVEHIGDAARHAGGEVAPGLAEHDDDAAGHVFAAMVAGALDDGDGAGVADGEALAGDAAEIALAGDGAVEHGVADDDRLFRHDAGVLRRAHDEAAAGEALADIVVGLADEVEGDAGGQPGAEALAAGAGQRDGDGVLGQAGEAVALGDLAGEHGAGGAVGVADRRPRS